MSAAFTVRRATMADLSVIARHRAEMFLEMGWLPAHLYDELVVATIRYLETAFPTEEYIGWLAAPAEQADQIAAGAGIQRRRTLPHPLSTTGNALVATGNQALVLNVYTERRWRRQGLAERLMRHILTWAGEAEVDTLVLHASDDGRRLYERLGFVETNEMRYARALQGSARAERE